MGSWNRIWIFFVIIAVGLVLSWGQVGKKVERTLAEDPTGLLRTEADCRPLSAPCAAAGTGLGLVLGPAGPGMLELRATSEQARVEDAQLYPLSGFEKPRSVAIEAATPGVWRTTLPPNVGVQGQWELRFKMSSPQVYAVFPVR